MFQWAFESGSLRAHVHLLAGSAWVVNCGLAVVAAQGFVIESVVMLAQTQKSRTNKRDDAPTVTQRGLNSSPVCKVALLFLQDDVLLG